VLPSRGRRLLIDIGGGSTEVVLGEGRTAEHAESLHMGCVNFTEGFFPDGKLSADRFRAASFAARLELEPLSRALADEHWQEAVGTSGTIEAIANIAKAAGWSGRRLTKVGLEKVREALLAAKNVGDVDLPELSDKRRPVLPGGVAILSAFFEVFGIEEIRFCEGALRDGVVEELIGRDHVESVRRATLDRLAERYDIDTGHAEAVGNTAVALLEQVAGDWDLPMPFSAELLQAAASVHEVGLSIRYGGYHKHGCYILDNSDMPGFSQDEQKLLARLVLCHRRKLRHETFEELHEPWNERGVRLALLLRLAVRLHRRRSEAVPPVKLGVKSTKMKLRLPEGYLEDHPLTRVDLDSEKKRVERAGYELKVK
jgi:exopolyphosphatase/guanosine-5'-triphosphate,3'-diphosphate pyrophosphatase